MARTFTPAEAEQFAVFMKGVSKITEEINETDARNNTKRPEGQSLGQLYERLGVHLVAMYREGVSPLHCLRLIRQVADDARELEAASMLAMMQAEQPDRTVFMESEPWSPGILLGMDPEPEDLN